MEKIKFENAKKDLCVICEQHIEIPTIWVCRQCLKQCEVDTSKIIEETRDKMIIDAKSKCCKADVQSMGRMTCSERCHMRFIEILEKEFGEIKKVIDDVAGIAYKIPTRDLIEKGLTYQDLQRYPKWEDPAISLVRDL